MTTDFRPFLDRSAIIDFDHPTVANAAAELKGDDVMATTKRCFEFVRDQIEHSADFRRNPTTCTASEVITHGTGYCYAKSHLLCALLRANAIPTALCYQRLSLDGKAAPYSLHGFNAVHLPELGWYRLDARGNRSDVDAQFDPPQERLAFSPTLVGEQDFPQRHAEPLSIVVSVLRRHSTWDAVMQNLPDVDSNGGA